MPRSNPLKHIIRTIRENASYNHTAVLAKLKLTEEQFAKKVERPSWTFVQDFAKHTDTRVDVSATFGRRSGSTAAVEFQF